MIYSVLKKDEQGTVSEVRIDEGIRRKSGEHKFADCGGSPKCVTCGADEDDAFVGGEPCSYKEKK
jgi:hypothetical protein